MMDDRHVYGVHSEGYGTRDRYAGFTIEVMAGILV